MPRLAGPFFSLYRARSTPAQQIHPHAFPDGCSERWDVKTMHAMRNVAIAREDFILSRLALLPG